MFSVNQTITSLIHPVMANAQRRLPVAHQRAQQAGVAHLHHQAQEAAAKAGFSKEALLVHSRGGTLYVAIDRSKAGDMLADHELGTPDEAPSPLLRTAMAGAHREASHIYRHALRREMGL